MAYQQQNPREAPPPMPPVLPGNAPPAPMHVGAPMRHNVAPPVARPPPPGFSMDRWTEDQVISHMKMVGPYFDFSRCQFPRGLELAAMRDIIFPNPSTTPTEGATGVLSLCLSKMRNVYHAVRNDPIAQECIWNVIWHENASVWYHGAAVHGSPGLLRKIVDIYVTAFRTAAASIGDDGKAIIVSDPGMLFLMAHVSFWVQLLDGIQYEVVMRKVPDNNGDSQVGAGPSRKRRRVTSGGNEDQVSIRKEDLPEQFRNLPNPIQAIIHSLELATDESIDAERARDDLLAAQNSATLRWNIEIAKKNATITKQEGVIAKLEATVEQLNATIAQHALAYQGQAANKDERQESQSDQS
ncbi:hypothetical protein GGS26DRAFT_604684 [Hypomontagnella submonticulosa]|nr:hypothetical protein GGS26DRAFT_604684 [Hypomontagnella submonticulosa]